MSDAKPGLGRRTLLKGLAAASGALLAGCGDEWAPTYGNILRMGDNLTWKGQRLLLPSKSLAREYQRSEISSILAIGTTNPADSGEGLYSTEFGPAYERLAHGGFADWRLEISGSVARPGSWSLEQLQRLRARTQITKHTCEEGWSAIAEWTGVPLHLVLEAAGMLPSARFVQFHAYDDVAEGFDLFDALHTQTILAWGMNGRALPPAHGAPLRLRVETQLGYKSLKFLRRIVVTDKFDDLGKQGAIQNGWSWYAGI
jgi:DMSO/TMAO reductase YedYZ molybdopterin-dependent catalytic subunit